MHSLGGICSMGTDGRTDGETDGRASLIVAFCNFTNASKKCLWKKTPTKK